MLAITCDKCRRRYSVTDEELQVYLSEAEGKKFAQVLCPHCGKPSKVATDRIHQAVRFSTPSAQQESTDAKLATPPAASDPANASVDEASPDSAA